MKPKSTIITLTVLLTFLFTQCGKKENTETTETSEHASGTVASEEAAPPQFVVDATFQEQLVRVFASYIKMKDAFVLSDPAQVKTATSAMRKLIDVFDSKMLSGAALNDWTSYLGGMELALAEIGSTDDIEAQRTAFSTLSDTLYKSIKAYGLGTATAFYDFCPMAFNNQGAFWLSDTKEIRNPYFGDKMLTCGNVEEVLK